MHLPAARTGTIALTDLHDAFAENALDGTAVGDFVRCKCLYSAGELCTSACSTFMGECRHQQKQRQMFLNPSSACKPRVSRLP